MVSTAARMRGSVALEELPWERLRMVRLRGGPAPDFVLQARSGREIVSLQQAPEGFLDRLQGLDGFDNGALVAGLSRPGAEADFICWRAPR